MRRAICVAALVGCAHASTAAVSAPAPAPVSAAASASAWVSNLGFEIVLESPTIVTKWKDAGSRLGLAPLEGRTFVVGMNRIVWLEGDDVVSDPSLEAGLAHDVDGRITGWIESILGRWPDAAFAQIGSTFFRWSATHWESIGSANAPFPRAVSARGGVIAIEFDHLAGFGLSQPVPLMPTTSIDLSLHVGLADDVFLSIDDDTWRWSPGSDAWTPSAPPALETDSPWRVSEGHLEHKTPSGAWSVVSLAHAAGHPAARSVFVVGGRVLVCATIDRPVDADVPLDVLYRATIATTSSRP